MQAEYNMHEKQLKMKEKITRATKEALSVILFDAMNGSSILVDKSADMSGPRGVAQFFVISWSWKNISWSLRFRKAFEEKFQIGNLLEMIDK